MESMGGFCGSGIMRDMKKYKIYILVAIGVLVAGGALLFGIQNQKDEEIILEIEGEVQEIIQDYFPDNEDGSFSEDIILIPGQYNIVPTPVYPHGMDENSEYREVGDNYYVLDSVAYYRTYSRPHFEMIEVEVSTFESEWDKYAKDKNHVYYKKEILKGVDPETFVEIEYSFFKDSEHVYKDGVETDQADPETFKLYSDPDGKDGTMSYAKDAYHVYDAYSGEMFEDADPETFVWISSTLQKDKDHVYFWGGGGSRAIIKGINAQTFEQVGQNYYKDRDSVIYIGSAQTIRMAWENYGEIVRVLEDADPDTFEIISKGYVRDVESVWYWYLPVVDANPKTLVVDDTQKRAAYARDDNSVFYRDMKLTKLDPSRTQFISGTYAIDDNEVYYMEHHITGLDRESFEVIQEDPYRTAFAKDKDTLFFTGYEILGIDPVAIEAIEFLSESPSGITYLLKDSKKVYTTRIKFNVKSLEEPVVNIYTPTDIENCSVSNLKACGIEINKG